MPSKQTKIDFGNYREMSEPFASSEEANTALQAFFDEVAEARIKHKITDVLLVVSCIAVTAEGEAAFVTHAHFGDEFKVESMAAYAFGRASADREATTAQLLAGKSRRMSVKG